jgi:hypothetical protein
MKAMWLACLEYRMLVLGGHTPELTEGWTGWRPEQGEQVAELVVARLRG